MSKGTKAWCADEDRTLRLMADGGWSVHMAAAQFSRLPYDVETRAEVLGIKFYDRTAAKQNCTKCGRDNNTECPFFWSNCEFGK